MRTAEANSPAAWRLVAVVTLIHSSSTGLALGTFGSLTLAMEASYQGTRQSSSMAIGLMLLALMAVSAVAARLIERFSLRWTMIGGVVLGSIGYALASIAPTMGLVIACYALTIGPGVALFGPVACHTLVTRWVTGSLQGRALGLLNMPIVVMLAPLVIQPVLPAIGVRAVLLGIAILQLCLLPLVWWLRERPAGATDQAGQRHAPARTEPGEPLPVRRIVGGLCFWLIAIGYGIPSGAGAMLGVHFVPLMIDLGRGPAQASLLYAICAGAGILGAIIFGWISDRIGPVRALALDCAVQIVAFAVLLSDVPVAVLMAAALVAGICGAGVVPPFAMMLARIYGPASFPRVYGLGMLAVTPFAFGMTPLAGFLFVRTGAYYWPFGIAMAGLALAAMLLSILHAIRGRYPTAANQLAANERSTATSADG
jgi:MFS family permease